MIEWTLGTRQQDDYVGLILRRSDDLLAQEAIVRLWNRDATPAEIADALESAARDLRKRT